MAKGQGKPKDLWGKAAEGEKKASAASTSLGQEQGPPASRSVGLAIGHVIGL